MMKKTIIILIFPIFTLISCMETEIEIPIDFPEPKLVVNALFNTDSLWNIELSDCKYIYDTAEIAFVNDALVTISDSQGNVIELTNEGEGIYTSETEKPVVGEVYTITGEHPDYDNVRASNTLPDNIQFENIEWNEQIYYGGELHRKINVTFQDNPGDDYYLVRIFGNFKYFLEDEKTGLPDSAFYRYPIDFSSQSAAIDDSGGKHNQNFVTFTDDIFNGNQFTIDLLIPEYYFFFGENNEEGEWDSGLETIYISMSRISKEYYWYQTSYQAYLDAQGGLFAQPVQVYTNIENGLGIFAGYSSTMDSIMIRE